MANTKEQFRVIIYPDIETYVDKGTTLLKLSRDCQKLYSEPIIAAKVDNDIKELSYEIKRDCRIRFIDLTEEDGMRIYRRSLYFILIKAAYDLFPDRRVIISHAVNKGLFCELRGDKELEPGEVERLEERMKEIVRQAIPFKKREIPIDEAKELFKSTGRMDRYYSVDTGRSAL
jgi:uridine kinase